MAKYVYVYNRYDNGLQRVMRRLRTAIRQKRTELLENQSWILHHDNAPAHTSMFVREFLPHEVAVV